MHTSRLTYRGGELTERNYCETSMKGSTVPKSSVMPWFLWQILRRPQLVIDLVCEKR
jgi:hypothetical protein